MDYTLYLAQKFAILPTYNVVDQNDQTVFQVTSELALSRHLFVYGPSGKQLAEIKRVLFSWLDRFEIFQYGQMVGEVEQKFSFITRRLEVNYLGWQISGSFPYVNYEVYDASGRQIAVINRELFHLTDHYAIHYDNPANALNLLCVALAIDCVVDSAKAAASQ